jgi:hypothetical protein
MASKLSADKSTGGGAYAKLGGGKSLLGMNVPLDINEAKASA